MRKKHKHSSFKKKLLLHTPQIMILVGVCFVAVSVLHWVLRAQSLRLTDAVVSEYSQENLQPEKPLPTRISIQWFVDVDIEPHLYKEGEWTVSQSSASYLLQSTPPGQPGNTIIYGHNTRKILGNIRALTGSETIAITLSDGSIKNYTITTLAEVAPTDTTFLEPTEADVLTLYTCSGFLDKNRFIVRAVPSDSL